MGRRHPKKQRTSMISSEESVAGAPTLSDPLDVSSVRELIMVALAGYLPNPPASRRRAADQAVHTLTMAYPSSKVVHDQAWQLVIHDVFVQTWANGWLPIDVYHLAVKKLPREVHDYFAHYVTEHFEKFPRHSVHPRCLDQVRSIAQAARPMGFLHIDQLVELVGRIASLPVTPLIVPVPGDYVPTANEPAEVEVDGRMLEKVRALLAKAESTEFAAEAETFTAGAQRLMAKHSIDAALLAATQPEQVRRGAVTWRVHVEKPYDSQKSLLLGQVASANRCQAVWSPSVGVMSVVGFDAEVRAVETLFTSLLVQANAAMLREGAKHHADGSSRTRSFRNTFLQAFAVRIGERLAEATAAETTAAASSSRSLLPVLAQREQAVEHELHRIAPNIKQRKIRVANDAEGWHSGSAAADLASLASEKPLRPDRS